MTSVAGAFKALEEHVRGGRPYDVAGLAELSAADLRQSDEHDVATLLLLGALCARLDGGQSAAGPLFTVMERYTDSSLLYTGRILPRTEEIVRLLDRSVDERSLAGLEEAADHMSQGWSAYADSVFPEAFQRLAEGLGLDPEPRAFSEVSFVLWWRGLEAAASGEPAKARPLFEQSLARYRRYLYFADTAWLFTDLVVADLAAGEHERAAAVLEEQRGYVESVREQFPPARSAAKPYFHVGDVRSGEYGTFVESSALRPGELAPRDHELLRRYVRAAEFFLAACRYGRRRDFEAGLDVFSLGWTGFPESPYPRILRRLAERHAGHAGSEEWDVHLTAHERWHRMLRTYRVRVKPGPLIDAAVTLHEQLGHAGLREHAGLVLLDAAVLHARLHGRETAVEWITRYLAELRSTVPDALGAVVDHVQAPRRRGEWQSLSTYIGLRADLLAPEFLSVGVTDSRMSDPDRLDIALYGTRLSVEGVTVHEHAPAPLVDVLKVLGGDLMRAQDAGEDAPFLTAAELAERSGRTTAALAQTVRRFRAACKQAFSELTDWDIAQDAVVQGRPGYRMNPQRVGNFKVLSTEK
ncbi:tetratricopeptide repeat protein [Streptomyces sp. ODS28]|uniref:tetratricopeptide repeat protein n=1 Tax=Streptomyces sp. ODS28 TaxID=3136688 RepID=UPI0031ED43FF